MAVPINAAVEGDLDEAVARKLIERAGGAMGEVFGKNGKSALRKRINGFNNAARSPYAPWLVLVDLDNDEDCAPALRDAWLPHPAPGLCFRIAVREVEAWLMADAETLAASLSVSANRISKNPESLEKPKDEMVNLARRSRRPAIKQDMVPREGSGRRVGRAYTSRLIEYVRDKWRSKPPPNDRKACAGRFAVSRNSSRPHGNKP